MYKRGSKSFFVIFFVVIMTCPLMAYAQENEVKFDNQSGQAAQTWQTSWERFAKEIAPYPARSANCFDPDVKAKFDGKKVTWEGTVSKNAKYSEEKMFVMEMTPQPFKIVSGMAVDGGGSVNVGTIQVQPKKGSLDVWAKVPPGTKIRFSVVLKMPVYMVVASGEFVRLLFMLNDAEPLLSQ